MEKLFNLLDVFEDISFLLFFNFLNKSSLNILIDISSVSKNLSEFFFKFFSLNFLVFLNVLLGSIISASIFLGRFFIFFSFGSILLILLYFKSILFSVFDFLENVFE